MIPEIATMDAQVTCGLQLEQTGEPPALSAYFSEVLITPVSSLLWSLKLAGGVRGFPVVPPGYGWTLQRFLTLIIHQYMEFSKQVHPCSNVM